MHVKPISIQRIVHENGFEICINEDERVRLIALIRHGVKEADKHTSFYDLQATANSFLRALGVTP